MSPATSFRLKGKDKDSYLELVLAFPLASIRNDTHLSAAQRILDNLLAQDLDPGAELYLDALSDLVGTYEDEHYSIESATDADLLRHFMHAKGVSQTDLHRETGLPKSSISEVLAGKKPFSRQMIRKLADYFGIDAGVLAANI